jgi:hypothetical protein
MIITTIHPQPGETRWDKSELSREEALLLAREYWDVVEIVRCVSRSEWSVKTHSGWCGLVGLIGGNRAILIKEPDGSRTLYIHNY